MTPKSLSREEIAEILMPLQVGSTRISAGSDVELIIVDLLLDIRDLLIKDNK